MKFPRYVRVLLAIASGAALGLAFPNYNFYLLAWIAMGLLVLASVDAPLKEAPLYGFLHGQVFYPVCLPWVDTVMRQYGNIDPWIAAAFVGMIGFIGGLICTIFSTGVALASRKSKLLACALAPFLWTTLEYFRTNIPIIGSSWDLSGYPAAHSLALLQITSVDRDLRIVFFDCGVWVVAGLRGFDAHAAGLDDCGGSDDSAGGRGDGGALSGADARRRGTWRIWCRPIFRSRRVIRRIG